MVKLHSRTELGRKVEIRNKGLKKTKITTEIYKRMSDSPKVSSGKATIIGGGLRSILVGIAENEYVAVNARLKKERKAAEVKLGVFNQMLNDVEKSMSRNQIPKMSKAEVKEALDAVRWEIHCEKDRKRLSKKYPNDKWAIDQAYSKKMTPDQFKKVGYVIVRKTPADIIAERKKNNKILTRFKR
jgi:hypothetical protein